MRPLTPMLLALGLTVCTSSIEAVDRRPLQELAAVSDGFLARRGLRGRTVFAKSTGRTSGHIATVTVKNTSDEPIQVSVSPTLIPSYRGYQGYVVTDAMDIGIGAQSELSFPIYGFGTNVFQKAVPEGTMLPNVDEWILPNEGLDTKEVELVHAVHQLQKAYEQLSSTSNIRTPLIREPAQERAALIQQSLWLHASRYRERPYTKDLFRSRMTQQFTANFGESPEQRGGKDLAQFNEGVEAFWTSFELLSSLIHAKRA